MRIVVLGGTGLIGAAVVARGMQQGHHVVAVARRVPNPQRETSVAGPDWRAADLGKNAVEDWRTIVVGADAVVNCAGILQDAPGESTTAIHVDGLANLVSACEWAGVKRLVQISAIGVERDPASDFSRSKRAGDARLAESALDWVILRPSVVMGRRVYGGSAMFRGLAALPVLPVPPDTGPMQIVQLDDVVETIMLFLAHDAPARLSLDLAGPQRHSFAEVVRVHRRWLGWSPAREIEAPRWAADIAFAIGDALAHLGWRQPLRSNLRAELARGTTGDAEAWTRATGIRPTALNAALAAEPAGVQERWFAALYFLKPAVLAGLAVFWSLTGLVSLGPALEAGTEIVRESGAGQLSAPLAVAGACADLAIGIGIAVRRTARAALWAGIALSVTYAIAGAVLVPRLLIDPLGPLLKIAPIVLLMLVALAILRDR